MPQEPRAIPLAMAEQVSHDAGVTDRPSMVDGVRWAIVEYRPGAKRLNWCNTPHSGFVVTGAIRYDFEDGRQALIVSAGSAFLLPNQPRHKGMNPGEVTTRMFLIDALLLS